MDNQCRMRRVLGVLVAAMTVGAFFLASMMPAKSIITNTTLMARLDGKDSKNELRQSPWRAIQVSPQSMEQRINPEDAHFLVYRNGDWERTVNWYSQRSLDPEPVVKIGLPANANKVTPAQHATTLKLIHELQRACGISEGQIRWDRRLTLPRTTSAG